MIGRAIRSLLGQDYPGRFSVVVTDDHSGDGTADLARAAAAAAGGRRPFDGRRRGAIAVRLERQDVGAVPRPGRGGRTSIPTPNCGC